MVVHFIRTLMRGGMWETDAIINQRAIFKDEAVLEEKAVVTSKTNAGESL